MYHLIVVMKNILKTNYFLNTLNKFKLNKILQRMLFCDVKFTHKCYMHILCCLILLNTISTCKIRSSVNTKKKKNHSFQFLY